MSFHYYRNRTYWGFGFMFEPWDFGRAFGLRVQVLCFEAYIPLWGRA
jgi:hypothetical protein